MVKLYTCRSGRLLMKEGETFIAWTDKSDWYRKGDYKIEVPEKYLEAGDEPYDFTVMDPTKVKIID